MTLPHLPDAGKQPLKVKDTGRCLSEYATARLRVLVPCAAFNSPSLLASCIYQTSKCLMKRSPACCPHCLKFTRHEHARGLLSLIQRWSSCLMTLSQIQNCATEEWGELFLPSLPRGFSPQEMLLVQPSLVEDMLILAEEAGSFRLCLML